MNKGVVSIKTVANDTHCYMDIREVKKSIDKIVNNSVVKEFLSIEENEDILKKAIESPTTNNLKELDQKFKKFYRYNRIIRYVSGLIRRYPIDYDKRVRVRNKRYQLTLDKPINDEQERSSPLTELIPNGEEQILDQLITKEFNEYGLFRIENKMLLKAFKLLNKKQCVILFLYYEKGFTNREIAHFFGQTESNISYWHKKTIRQLKEIMSKTNSRSESDG
ncbi:sigma-70 family RNA polymerase sigma factor [Heyndrickxia ginsengihumi]|uniref:sigma-70 family RNA polymerase sigma factor n=1 Tax=Heyndrickxia ginsengihumi TaxID=363870 RepID=UPI00203B82C7|nr:sigma-70 family RNA polymerase sigma factor [Heyndrickxia ginsengihumi]MCM3024981.1 sigma-70 family RNA polymerase sigma factor [Heyndrickxia ginsengihumi]